MPNCPVPGVYVAGPLGFAETTRLFYADVLVPAVEACGAVVLDPWAAPFDDMDAAAAVTDCAQRVDALRAANLKHGEYNQRLLRQCRAVFAVLDGPDVDSGTAAEIGYAAALGRPIVGWRSDLRRTGDNDGCVVNLQVEWFVAQSGGAVFVDLAAALDALKRVLAGGPAAVPAR